TPDGQTVAALVYVHAPNHVDERSEVTLWDAATGWKPQMFEGPPLTFHDAIAFSPSGSVFATGSDGDLKGDSRHFVTIWDVVTGKLLVRGPEDRGARVAKGALAFSPDGKKLLWGDFDSTINLWDLETRVVRTFKGHKAHCIGVAFDPRGRWIASASH